MFASKVSHLEPSLAISMRFGSPIGFGAIIGLVEARRIDRVKRESTIGARRDRRDVRRLDTDGWRTIMAKGPREPRVDHVAPERPPGSKRRIRRLEARLVHLREVEAKRVGQLERARVRSLSLETRLNGLRPASGAPEPAPVAPEAGLMAYCMRERRMVSIVNPEPSVMRNGRAAIAGTCPSCGARVVTTARATGKTATGE